MRKLPALLGAGAAIVAVGATTAVADPPEDRQSRSEPQFFHVDLDPLNDSGVDGTARLKVHKGTLKVQIKADGLVPGKTHPQHIHGFDDASRNADCPEPEDRDDIKNSPEEAANPDEILSVAEGLPDYGEIRKPLTPFPEARRNGKVRFTERYGPGELSDLSLENLENRHIVLHGLTVQSAGGGETYVATIPVACGQIERGR